MKNLTKHTILIHCCLLFLRCFGNNDDFQLENEVNEIKRNKKSNRQDLDKNLNTNSEENVFSPQNDMTDNKNIDYYKILGSNNNIHLFRLRGEYLGPSSSTLKYLDINQIKNKNISSPLVKSIGWGKLILFINKDETWKEQSVNPDGGRADTIISPDSYTAWKFNKHRKNDDPKTNHLKNPSTHQPKLEGNGSAAHEIKRYVDDNISDIILLSTGMTEDLDINYEDITNNLKKYKGEKSKIIIISSTKTICEIHNDILLGNIDKCNNKYGLNLQKNKKYNLISLLHMTC